MHRTLSRRDFIVASAATAASALALPAVGAEAPEPIIDIHQHTHYAGRTDQQLLAHQRAMGVTKTILLPSGRPVERESTHDGKSNGLAAKTGGNETVVKLAREYAREFVFAANEVPDLPEARDELAKYLKLGAKLIAEQKFNVDCDSDSIVKIAGLAQEFGVPVLMHFQHDTYNKHFERFGKMLERFPKVTFIGHAQTWWGNIDRNHDQKVMYPAGKVTPGGLTDRYLSDYPNMFGDMSAGSGLNSMLRDEDHARGFLERHQDKLLYGSDCADTIGRGPGCQGAATLAAIRRLAANKQVERKILFENSRKLFKL